MNTSKAPARIQVKTGLRKADVVEIAGDVYVDLFENSYVHSIADYQNSLASGHITMNKLIELARKAEIPYSLFFAPKDLVKNQLERKNKMLLAGASKAAFSLNSRGNVELRDIELIVKDILRKQMLLKTGYKDPKNPLNGMIKRSKLSIAEQAKKIRLLLDIDLDLIHALDKDKTMDYLVGQLGKSNVFVSQSAKAHMPQTIQNHVRFSGICVKDSTYPFIFMNNKDEGENFEPAGRKVLTLALLIVCTAMGKFSAVTYSDSTKDLIEVKEFEIAEELLMPAEEMKDIEISDMTDLAEYAQIFSVTPSALLMRLRRLKLVNDTEADIYFDKLKQEFDDRKPHAFGHLTDINAFVRYNGPVYTDRVIAMVDNGDISRGDACRILLQNRHKPAFLDDLRGAI